MSWTTEATRPFEHSVSHLTVFLNFLGVTEIHTVLAEGLNVEPGRTDAKERAAQLARALGVTPATHPARVLIRQPLR